MKQKRTYDDDDGETIVDMNVDGMPWYNSRLETFKRGMSGGSEITRPPADDTDPDAGSAGGSGDGLSGVFGSGMSEPTKEEVRAYKFAALKASLFVIAIFGLVFGLFIAFCDFVLFR